MSRPRHIDGKLVSKARAVVLRTTDIRQLKAAQAVLLPALVGATLEQTASLLGVGRASVHRLQQQLRQSLRTPSLPRKKWGGRRRALLRRAEQRSVLFLLRHFMQRCKDTSWVCINQHSVAKLKRRALADLDMSFHPHPPSHHNPAGSLSSEWQPRAFHRASPATQTPAERSPHGP